jgi:hypothetical protein
MYDAALRAMLRRVDAVPQGGTLVRHRIEVVGGAAQG